jgi:FHA domain
MTIENQKKTKDSPDWFVNGILSRIGKFADSLTGRNPNKTSTYATSELAERLKLLLDSEVEDLGVRGKFVPHQIKLKMAWNQFSSDSPEILKAVEDELLIAAIDHINDRRYHLHAPIRVDVKADYFVEGVQIVASFESFSEVEKEAEVFVELPNSIAKESVPKAEILIETKGETIVAEFKIGELAKQVDLVFEKGKRLSVGRGKESDLTITDVTVSKSHASLALNAQNQIIVADIGSTNGTFLNGERIAYGRAFAVGDDGLVVFGTIEVFFRRVANPADFVFNPDNVDNTPATQPPLEGEF